VVIVAGGDMLGGKIVMAGKKVLLVARQGIRLLAPEMTT